MQKATCSIVLLLCSIALVSTENKNECETESAEEGICINLQNCFYLNEYIQTEDQPLQLKSLISREREKCINNNSDVDLVCCKRDPPVKLSWTFEDSKPLKKNVSDVLSGDEICGLFESANIFHGMPTDLGQYPWLVLIKYIKDGEVSFDCGGSIINKRYVVTAAHCINDHIYQIRLGEWNLQTNPDCSKKAGNTFCAPPVVDVAIEKIILHKNYTLHDSQGGKVDLALIRLKQDISFNEFVQPICLPSNENQAKIRSYFYVSGWGLTENGTTSPVKMFAILDHVQLDMCRNELNTTFIKIDDNMICAVGKHGEDACSGDSGGPLMQIGAVKIGGNDAPRLFLSGVVSKGLACGTTKPAFYTNVPKQMNWIISNMEYGMIKHIEF